MQHTISSGIDELDTLLGGGYPMMAVTVVHFLDAVSRERGQPYMIGKCVNPVILRQPTLHEAAMTLWEKAPELLVLDGLVEVAEKLPVFMEILNTRPATTVLLFADHDLVSLKAVKYFCRVRINLHESGTGIVGRLVKNTVSDYQGYSFDLNAS